MNKTSRRRNALVGAVALTVAFAGPLSLARAGHLNTVLEADLNGRNEVATGTKKGVVGDPNGTGEIYVFGIDANTTTLCYVLIVDKIETATAAHIHEAPEGENGPVVVNLAAPGDGNAADCLVESDGTKFPGAAVTVQEILSNPEDYYVNVHNGEYPDGAIRGQLAVQE